MISISFAIPLNKLLSSRTPFIFCFGQNADSNHEDQPETVEECESDLSDHASDIENDNGTGFISFLVPKVFGPTESIIEISFNSKTFQQFDRPLLFKGCCAHVHSPFPCRLSHETL